MTTKTDMPIVVHVYIRTIRRPGRSDSRWHSRTQAIEYAKKQFEKPYVYKVKVWDTERGPIIPNTPTAAALIIELV